MSVSKFTYAPVAPNDLERIAESIRPHDRVELEASGHSDILAALESSVARSDWSLVAHVPGGPAAVFGIAEVGTFLLPKAAPWMLGSTLLNSMGRQVLIDSQRIVHTMRCEYPLLENYVFEGSAKSIRWLRWLGFTVEDPQGGSHFCKFHVRGL